jgi:hypothetical protein
MSTHRVQPTGRLRSGRKQNKSVRSSRIDFFDFPNDDGSQENESEKSERVFALISLSLPSDLPGRTGL